MVVHPRILVIPTIGGIYCEISQKISAVIIFVQRTCNVKRFISHLRCLTTVLMEYKSAAFNSFEKGSKLFFPSLFTVCFYHFM